MHTVQKVSSSSESPHNGSSQKFSNLVLPLIVEVKVLSKQKDWSRVSVSERNPQNPLETVRSTANKVWWTQIFKLTCVCVCVQQMTTANARCQILPQTPTLPPIITTIDVISLKRNECSGRVRLYPGLFSVWNSFHGSSRVTCKHRGTGLGWAKATGSFQVAAGQTRPTMGLLCHAGKSKHWGFSAFTCEIQPGRRGKNDLLEFTGSASVQPEISFLHNANPQALELIVYSAF